MEEAPSEKNMTTFATKKKETEPKIFNFLIAPVGLINDIQLPMTSIISWDRSAATAQVRLLHQIPKSGLREHFMNEYTLGQLLKLSENYIETTGPPEIVEPMKEETKPVLQMKPEHWLKYLRDECKKIGYGLHKIKSSNKN